MEALWQNFQHLQWQQVVMHSIGVIVSGQIASVIAGGLILALVKGKLGI